MAPRSGRWVRRPRQPSTPSTSTTRRAVTAAGYRTLRISDSTAAPILSVDHALAAAPGRDRLEVRGCDPHLAVHLAPWARARGPHRRRRHRRKGHGHATGGATPSGGAAGRAEARRPRPRPVGLAARVRWWRRAGPTRRGRPGRQGRGVGRHRPQALRPSGGPRSGTGSHRLGHAGRPTPRGGSGRRAR